MTKFAALLVFAIPSLGFADVISFDADSEIMTVRITQVSNITRVELLASEDGSILCVAMDSDGEPLATASSFAEMGVVSFHDLDADTVASVACRFN